MTPPPYQKRFPHTIKLGRNNPISLATKDNPFAWKQMLVSPEGRKQTVAENFQSRINIYGYAKFLRQHRAGMQNLYFSHNVYLFAKQELEHNAAKIGVPPEVFKGMLFTECNGRLDAVSRANCVGVMQLRNGLPNEFGFPATDSSGHDVRLNPEQNIRIAAEYLKNLIKSSVTKNNWIMAVVCYNYGTGNISKAIRNYLSSHRLKGNGNSLGDYGDLIMNNLTFVPLVESLPRGKWDGKDYLYEAYGTGLIIRITEALAEEFRRLGQEGRERFVKEFRLNAMMTKAMEHYKKTAREWKARTGKSPPYSEALAKNNHLALALQILFAGTITEAIKENPNLIGQLYEQPVPTLYGILGVKGIPELRNNELTEKPVPLPPHLAKRNPSKTHNTTRNQQLSTVPKNINPGSKLMSRDGVSLKRTYSYNGITRAFQLGLTSPIAEATDMSKNVGSDGVHNASPLFGAIRAGGRTHRGLDVYAPIGTNVRSCADGVVVYVQTTDAYKKPKLWEGNPYLNGKHGTHYAAYGTFVVVRHKSTGPKGYFYTVYAHLGKVSVKAGQKVFCGDKLGEVGRTGNARGIGEHATHVHLDVRVPTHRPIPGRSGFFYDPPYDASVCRPINPLEN